jgi:hypothetical protein
LAIAAVASAKSFTGNRLLVVLEEQAEREKYSVFLEDLAGKCDLQLALVGEVRHAPGLGWLLSQSYEVSSCWKRSIRKLLLDMQLGWSL